MDQKMLDYLMCCFSSLVHKNRNVPLASICALSGSLFMENAFFLKDKTLGGVLQPRAKVFNDLQLQSNFK